MQMTFRWFGKEKDTVSLEQIRQIPGVTGVVPALHDLAPPVRRGPWTEYRPCMTRSLLPADHGVH